MFSDEPLNLNQARTKCVDEQKLIFLYICNSGRSIVELDEPDLDRIIERFVNFLISLGYPESSVWEAISSGVNERNSYENIRKQFGYLDKASDIM
jgi:hypothetical protein